MTAFLQNQRVTGAALLCDPIVDYTPELGKALILRMAEVLPIGELHDEFMESLYQDYIDRHGVDPPPCMNDGPHEASAILPLNEVIEAWIKFEESKWADRELDNMLRHDPQKAWQYIQAIIDATESKDVLCYIAAGPLENLLSYHGEEFIAVVEEKAAADLRFKLCLSGVWRLFMTDDVWSRVNKAREGVNIDLWEGPLPKPGTVPPPIVHPKRRKLNTEKRVSATRKKSIRWI